MEYFESGGPIIPAEQTKIFDMVLSMGETLIPCDVYFATMEGGNTFTRVLMYPGTAEERMIDLDKQDGAWISIYDMEPTLWTELVADALDYHIAERNREQKQQN